MLSFVNEGMEPLSSVYDNYEIVVWYVYIIFKVLIVGIAPLCYCLG